MRRLLALAVVAAVVAAFGAGAAKAALPDAPTNVVATLGDGRAAVTWTAPDSDGGSPITEYIVTASGGSNQTCVVEAGAKLQCVVRRLVNGTSYTFTVKAYNTNGGGPASAPSNAVTPASAPGPPTDVTATPGNHEAVVGCTAPASNGGAAITSYTATSSPSGRHGTAASCPVTVTGLVNGTSYTFTVTASNGTKGPASAPSTAVTPADTRPPSRPARLIGRFAGHSLILHWSPSKSALGVAGYQIHLNGKPLLSVRGTTTATLHAFDKHGDSVYTVTAFDAAGKQSSSSPSVTVRPTPLPRGVPHTIPAWALKMLAWQEHGSTGARPKTPHPLPAWYSAWKSWHGEPFEIVP